MVKPGGAIICESPAEEELPESVGDFAVNRQYRYGRIKVTFYRIPDEGEESDRGDDE